MRRSPRDKMGAAMPHKYKWELWQGSASEHESWEVPGVYALVAAKEKYPTVLGRGSRVLYLGEAKRLNQRIGTRVKGKRSHSILWYLDDAKCDKTEMPLELNGLLKKIDNKYCPIVYAYNLVADPPNRWNNGEHKPVNKLFEEVLLIQHFFAFGQFPPLNAMSRSIMSIYAFWTEYWWRDFWKSPENWKLPKGVVEKCWKELLKKK